MSSAAVRGGMIFKPLYYADCLTIVNPVGDVGLVTLWSPVGVARRLLEHGSPEILDTGTSRIAVMSPLYGDGLLQMLCNLLYNPQIRHLIAIGEDLGLPTVTEIARFLESGLEETVMLGEAVFRISGTSRFFPLLKDFNVERLRHQLSFSYLGKLAGGEAVRRLPEYVVSLPRHTPPAADERLHVEISSASQYGYAYRPSDVTGHQVIRRRPLDCWEELVTRTVRFGHPVKLRSGRRLELLNVKAVITEPADDPAEALKNYGFSLERFRDYQSKILNDELPSGIPYSYGNRLRRHFRRNGRQIDTLDSVVGILRRDPESRNAYISLWDTALDLPTASSQIPASVPSLVTLFFRNSQGRLTLTGTYRSHNLLTAWLQNVYGLISIQQSVCNQIQMPPGAITVISHSLGIDPDSPRYEFARGIAERWTRDVDVDRNTGRRTLREDPNGYFIVAVDNDEIVVEHRYKGVLLKQYRSQEVPRIEREIIGDMAVSLVSHGLWLGRELMTKAEIIRRQRGRKR